MLHVQTVNQITEIDRLTSERYGISSLLLMENAAFRAMQEIEKYLGVLSGKVVKIFCGKGNNGGDGAALARQLWMRGVAVEVFLLAKRETLSGDARINFDSIYHLSKVEQTLLKFVEVISLSNFPGVVSQFSSTCSLYVDAILGTGLKQPVSGLYEGVVDYLNSQRENINGVPVCSLDIPSGLAADQSNLIGSCIKADLTVVFTAPKTANVLPPACDHNGILQVVNIGSPNALLGSTDANKSQLHFIEDIDIKRLLISGQRKAGAHKGSLGHVLLVAGSRGKTGAAVLTAEAVLRVGAGLVTVVSPRSIQHMIAASSIPEVMTLGVVETDSGILAEQAADSILEQIATKEILALGPGISSEETVKKLVQKTVSLCQKPMVIDADGLNCLSPWPDWLVGTSERPIIITPHLGEMARLTGLPIKTIANNRVNCARAMAREKKIYVVLKGQRTVIASPDGEVYINPTGNAGMATAGAGDVLTGVIAGLLAQMPLAPFEALLQSVYLHGLSGDKAACKVGLRSLIASDITKHLSEALLTTEGCL